MTNFLLGIIKDGQIMNPNEVAPSEVATPANYDAPRFAVAAGRALLGRHADALGFTVAKTFNAGHYRTVHTEMRS